MVFYIMKFLKIFRSFILSLVLSLQDTWNSEQSKCQFRCFSTELPVWIQNIFLLLVPEKARISGRITTLFNQEQNDSNWCMQHSKQNLIFKQLKCEYCSSCHITITLSHSPCIYLEQKCSAIMLQSLVEMEFYAIVIFMIE